MATITSYETKAGKRWRVRYRKPDRSQTDKRGFKTKRDASEFAATVETSKITGTYIDPSRGKMTVGELYEKWITTKRATLKPSSLHSLETSWRVHVKPEWENVPLVGVEHEDVQAWVDSIGKSHTTVVRAYGILSGVMALAERGKRVSADPTRNIALPEKRSGKRRRYLTHAELIRLAEHSGDRGTLVLLLGWCGLRWGEAIELRVRDLNMLKRRIHVSRAAVETGGVIHVGSPKNGTERDVPMPKALADLIARDCDGKGRDDLLFHDKHGHHLRRTRVSAGSRSWFKTALESAGIEPMTLHDLRHTTASLAVQSGANVKAVQRMLGHASAAMTLDIYSDLFDSDLEALGDRLDEVIAPLSVGKMWAKEA